MRQHSARIRQIDPHAEIAKAAKIQLLESTRESKAVFVQENKALLALN
jgi:hypothetical protein